MKILLLLLHCILYSFLLLDSCYCGEAESLSPSFTNEWAVEITGGEQIARDVANDNGFKFLQQVGTLQDIYHFQHVKSTRRAKRSLTDLTALLESDPRVEQAEQQLVGEHSRRSISKGHSHLPDPNLLSRRDGIQGTRGEDTRAKLTEDGEQVLSPGQTGDDYVIKFNDPMYPQQWYLFNPDGFGGSVKNLDMNCMPAWKLGYTGKGVVVSVLDDGVDGTHPDLDQNFDIYASFDMNNLTEPCDDENFSVSKDGDHDPHPDDTGGSKKNGHGTKCAGEIAAEADNHLCGIGIAYNARIGGVRILDGSVTDCMEAAALLFNNSYIDVYSCCWGPHDDGKTFGKPGKLTKRALEQGIKEGREGKGSIYVWAAGNGGLGDDCCGADGYVGSIYSISVASITGQGRSAFYMEECSSTLAGAVVGATHHHDVMVGIAENDVVTTDLHGACTNRFTGTSSAAPLASGIFAVVLEVNPELTWRDLQHIIVNSARLPNPAEEGWAINGAGFHHNHMFGFGMLDLGKMVSLALTWTNVGPQITCQVPFDKVDTDVNKGESRNFTIDVDNCGDIEQLEHVEIHVSYEVPRRGDIAFNLYSPMGTMSKLMKTRPRDSNLGGLDKWTFMTVHSWGEKPDGEWTLEFCYVPPEDAVIDKDFPPEEVGFATLIKWGMTLYGTGEGDGAQTVTDDNPAINPELKLKSDTETIVEVYNSEQREEEEVVEDLHDLSKNANLPPNLLNNLDSEGNINTKTGEGFDGKAIHKGKEVDESRLQNQHTKSKPPLPGNAISDKEDVYKLAGDPDPIIGTRELEELLRELMAEDPGEEREWGAAETRHNHLPQSVRRGELARLLKEFGEEQLEEIVYEVAKKALIRQMENLTEKEMEELWQDLAKRILIRHLQDLTDKELDEVAYFLAEELVERRRR